MTGTGDEIHNTVDGTVHADSVVQARDIHLHLHGEVPAPASDHPDPWVRQVLRSTAWDCVQSGHDLRARAAAVAGHLAVVRDEAGARLAADPWRDDQVAARFAKRIGWLLKRLNLELAPAEAALLALVPLLHQALWDRAAARLVDVGPTDLDQTGRRERIDYERYLRDHDRLVDRALLPDLPDRPDAQVEIGWWLFNRWVRQRAEEVKRRAVGELLAGTGMPEVLDVDRVRELLYGLRLEPQALCALDRLGGTAPHDVLHGGEPDEQRLRVPLLGLLLGVAHTATVPVTDLSDTIAWHLGIPAPVDLDRLRETLDKAAWQTQADGLVLKAACQHGAVIEALREHAVRMDALLHAVRRAAEKHGGLDVLGRLPVRASADQVDAAHDPDGKPEFSGWSRFSLDEQRVRELLMGEQLYRDRDLAIRELYQNALDACRYRRAREQYVARTTDRLSAWQGRITFTQGVDENGRAYLDCVDNGVGMGEGELKGVFSRAGVRFADLAEFHDEQADWNALDPPVELYPNSRFGIGVLSYFMLADEITVTTCRMARDGGRRGPTLQATISGPGHLFQIRPVEDRGGPGTTVRLYLRGGEKTSCVQVLRRVLGIAEFATTARHGPEREQWEPGVFHARRRPSWKPEGLNAHGALIPVVDGRVIWCEHGGAILVDGLLAQPTHLHGVLAAPASDKSFTGAVVNLAGKQVPRLSVDRAKIVDDVSEVVEDLLVQGMGELDFSGPVVFEWIDQVAWRTPRLADLVAARGALGVEAVRFPQDINLVGDLRDEYRGPADRLRWMMRSMSAKGLPDHIYLWRLLTYGSDLVDLVPELSHVGPLLPALPSDGALLAEIWPDILSWRSQYQSLTPYDILAAAWSTGTTPREMARRAAALHLGSLDSECFSGSRVPDPDDRLLVLNTLGSLVGSVGHSYRASAGQVLHGHLGLGLSLPEVASRLARYGFDVEVVDRLPDDVDEVDLNLLSRYSSGIGSWLAEEFPVPLVHVARVSEDLGIPTGLVRERLLRFGFVLEAAEGLFPSYSDRDFVLLSHRLDGIPPWLDRAVPVPPGHLVAAAVAFNMPLQAVVDVLAAYGFDCPAMPSHRPAVEDKLLLSRGVIGLESWLRAGQPLPPHHIPMFRHQHNLAQQEVVRRLNAYGFEVTDDDLRDDLSLNDLLLLSRDFDGVSPWLNRGEPITLAHLAEAGARFSMTITEVADRLRQLGVDLPDPADMIRAAIPKIPLAR
ncbi:wHTH domain-containing protein [Saccharothrix syringae]|uniref:Uncharacterized protein n=1 Tax=Saccharothrix syringae TaxID=103733 RepID=A0A5Q0H138_SACSY|nr:hypothetical protein [Saccharothrix syringae]QFZ19889.1 hypothetical protein EKG83_22850 [Saccharothrix syringae]